MEQVLIPTGLLVLVIGSLIGVKVALKDKPSFKQTEERYQKKELCNEIHKSVTEKLDCIPTIKETVTRLETKVDILVKNNGKK